MAILEKGVMSLPKYIFAVEMARKKNPLRPVKKAS
jgi:hypothetical protein